MSNFTLITPYAKQVTQDYKNLQQKEIEILDLNLKVKFEINNDNFFIEKKLRSYSDILLSLSENDKVYFLLPKCFNKNKILQFVEDFVVACTYLKIKSIVFDKSRCDSIRQFEKEGICNQIEEMLIDSGLPIIDIKSNPLEKPSKLYYKTFNTTLIKNDLAAIKVAYNQLHNIYDIKDAFHLCHYKKVNTSSKIISKGFTKGAFSYTLN